jgi:hypothetical protein
MDIRFLNSRPEFVPLLGRLQVEEWTHLYADWNLAAAQA